LGWPIRRLRPPARIIALAKGVIGPAAFRDAPAHPTDYQSPGPFHTQSGDDFA
jgi:hypothetical protein